MFNSTVIKFYHYLCQEVKNSTSKKALVIGINEYDNLETLNFCKNDGNAMLSLLSSCRYQIDKHKKLIGYVTWAEMREEIINFFTDPSVDIRIRYYSTILVTRYQTQMAKYISQPLKLTMNTLTTKEFLSMN